MPPAYDTVAPTEPVKPVPTVDEWGPFDAYQEVTTPHGVYGVPVGTILSFAEGQVWDPKQQRTITTMLPQYRKVRLDSPKVQPNKLPKHFTLGDQIVNRIAGNPIMSGATPAPAADNSGEIDALKETVAKQQAQIEALLAKSHSDPSAGEHADVKEHREAREVEPGVFATGTMSASPPPEPQKPTVERPPAHGPYASRDAWVAYAHSLGVTVDVEMTRAQIVEACEQVEAG